MENHKLDEEGKAHKCVFCDAPTNWAHMRSSPDKLIPYCCICLDGLIAAHERTSNPIKTYDKLRERIDMLHEAVARKSAALAMQFSENTELRKQIKAFKVVVAETKAANDALVAEVEALRLETIL